MRVKFIIALLYLGLCFKAEAQIRAIEKTQDLRKIESNSLRLVVTIVPQSTFVIIKTESAATEPINLEIINLLGQKVQTIFHGMTSADEKTFVFNTQNLINGIYLIKLGNSKTQTVKKLIINRS